MAWQYTGNSAGAGVIMVQSKAETGTVSPLGTRTPEMIGELYYNLTDSALWVATGITVADWEVQASGGDLTFSIQTTDATPVMIGSLPVTANQTFIFYGSFIARKLSGAGSGSVGDVDVFSRKVIAKDISGTLTIADITTPDTYKENLSWDFSAVVNVNEIELYVTGDLNNTVNWQVSYHTEVF